MYCSTFSTFDDKLSPCCLNTFFQTFWNYGLTKYQLIGKDVRAHKLPADWQRRRQSSQITSWLAKTTSELINYHWLAKTTSELTNYQLIGKDGVRAYNLPADWQRRRQILLAMVRSRSSSTEKKSPKKGSFKEAGRIIQKLADFYDLDWFDLWTGRQALKFSNTV